MARSKDSVAVLIPAAGVGRRLGGAKKQFRLLGGKPLFIRTLDVFDRHEEVDCIVIAVADEEKDSVTHQIAGENFSKDCAVVAGGSTRQFSVYAALRALPARANLVLVHDAVRPFVAEESISRLIDSVQHQGAAALAIPVADTLRSGESRVFKDTIPRNGLYQMQTPQGARRSWLEEAHKQALAEGWSATDDVELLQKTGYEVAIVEGSSMNFKITTQADWELARILWHERSKI